MYCGSIIPSDNQLSDVASGSLLHPKKYLFVFLGSFAEILNGTPYVAVCDDGKFVAPSPEYVTVNCLLDTTSFGEMFPASSFNSKYTLSSAGALKSAKVCQG